MSRLSKETVIRRYYLYRAVSRPNFHYPVYTIFLLFNGLTLPQIGLIATLQSIITVGGEIPTGYVGDRVGRRNSLAIGGALMIVSNASYLVATDFVGFSFTFLTLSFGGTFLSGSGTAWLYDTLDEHGMEDEFTRVSGRSRSIMRWVQVVAMPIGGLLYTIDRAYPFYAGVAAAAIALVLVLRLPKNRIYVDDLDAEDDDEDDDRLTIVDALPIIKDQIKSPDLRWFVVYIALFSGAIWTMDMWIQPIAQDALESSFGPTLRTKWGLSEGIILGLLYAAFTLVSAVASDYASNLEDYLGVRKAVMLVPAVIAGSYMLAGVLPVLAFPMFFMMKGGTALTGPIQNRYINDQVQSVGRATLLSSINMLRQVAGIPFRVGSGVLAGMVGTLHMVATLGVLFLVGSALLWVFASPIRKDYEGPSGSPSTAADGGTPEE